MRKLNGGDIFPALRVLRAMDLSDPINKLIEEVSKAETEEAKSVAGIGFLGNCLEKALDSKGGEQLIFSFLAGPLEQPNGDAVRAMDLNALADAIIQLTEENDLISFFTKVKRIMRM